MFDNFFSVFVLFNQMAHTHGSITKSLEAIDAIKAFVRKWSLSRKPEYSLYHLLN